VGELVSGEKEEEEEGPATSVIIQIKIMVVHFLPLPTHTHHTHTHYTARCVQDRRVGETTGLSDGIANDFRASAIITAPRHASPSLSSKPPHA